MKVSKIEYHNIAFLGVQLGFVFSCPIFNHLKRFLGREVLTWKKQLVDSNVRGNMVFEIVGAQHKKLGTDGHQTEGRKEERKKSHIEVAAPLKN